MEVEGISEVKISFTTDSFYTMCITDFDKLNLVTLGHDGLVLSTSQFLLLLSQKTKLASKVVKSYYKIIILVHWSKFVTHFVQSVSQI